MAHTHDDRPHDAQQDPSRDRVADFTADGRSTDDRSTDDRSTDDRSTEDEPSDGAGAAGSQRSDERGEGDDPDPTDPEPEEVAELDPMAPGRWLFEDTDEDDAVEPNEPG
jgi:hypothetical protein